VVEIAPQFGRCGCEPQEEDEKNSEAKTNYWYDEVRASENESTTAGERAIEADSTINDERNLFSS
jgi:hypothetical protein